MSPPGRRIEHLGRHVIERAQHRAIGDRALLHAGARAKPRSTNVTWPLGETKTLLGFTSACIQPASCNAVERLGHLAGDPDDDRQVEQCRLVAIARRACRPRATASPGSRAIRFNCAARIGTRCGLATRRPTSASRARMARPQGCVLPLVAQRLDRVAGRPIGRSVGGPGLIDARQLALAHQAHQLPRAKATRKRRVGRGARSAIGGASSSWRVHRHAVGARRDEARRGAKDCIGFLGDES